MGMRVYTHNGKFLKLSEFFYAYLDMYRKTRSTAYLLCANFTMLNVVMQKLLKYWLTHRSLFFGANFLSKQKSPSNIFFKNLQVYWVIWTLYFFEVIRKNGAFIVLRKKKKTNLLVCICKNVC